MNKEERFLLEIGQVLTSNNSDRIKLINIKYIYKIWLEALAQERLREKHNNDE